MNNRLLNLDGIRAFACLFVVLMHLPLPFSRTIFGPLGVGIFFTLSGFLMGHLYGHKSWEKSTLISYSVARISRIVPIYWLTIIVCVVLSVFISDPDFPMRIDSVKQISRHLLFGGSVSVFWSISPEVQYYIFFVLVWWAIAFRKTVSIAVPAVLGACVVLLLTHKYWPGLAMPSKLHFFLAGTLAGTAPRLRWETASQKLSLAVLQVGSIVILIVPFFLYDTKEEFYDSVEMGVALALCLYCLSFNSRGTAPIFASALMRKIGQASFSIYLMHVMVFYFGAKLLNLQQDVYEPLWLTLLVPAVALPMLVSQFVEIPLQSVARRMLEKGLDNIKAKRPSLAASDLPQ